MNYLKKTSKRNILFALIGFLCGTMAGVSLISFFVPDAKSLILLYKQQKELVSELRTGKQADTSVMWLENAKSMRAKSKDEFVSDMININNTVILMNSRLQFGMYPSTKELRFFGDETARERRTENDVLRKLQPTLLP